MPLGGENIGTAYVRIVARGEKLDDDIREMFDEDSFKETGRRNSDAYAEGWREEMNKAPNRERLREGIRDALIKGDYLEQDFFRSRNWTNFRSGMERQFGEAGRLAGHRMEEQLRRTGVGALDNMLDSTLARVVSAQAELERESEKMEREHSAALLENDRRTQKAQDEIQRRGLLQERAIMEDRMREERKQQDLQRQGLLQERAIAEDRARTIRQQVEIQRQGVMQERAINENRRRDLEKLRETFALLNREQSQLLAGDPNAQSRSELLGHINTIRTGMRRLGYDNAVWTESLRDSENRLRFINPRLHEFSTKINRLGDAVGKAFGEGSRNNFVNFMGAFSGNIVRSAAIFPRFASGLINMGRRAKATGSVLGGLGSILRDVAGLVARATGALAGLFGIVGPILSVFSQLAGVLVALTGSLGFSIVGAVGAAGASLLPLVAIIGTTVLGFKNLTGASKTAATALGEEFKAGLGKAAAAGLQFNRGLEESHDHTIHSFAEVLGGLRSMVKRLEPVLFEAGRGVADAMDIFAFSVGKAGGSWDKFIDAITGNGKDEIGFIGNQTRILGVAIGHLFSGMLGLFRGLLPSARAFDGWLRDIATRFDKWANSAKGQNSIKNYMDEALESTKAVGHFLHSVYDLFGVLLRQGRDTGDSLFESMADSIDRWTSTLNNNPNILNKWFKDAEAFGRVVGNLFVGLGKVFDALDNEFSRAASTFVFSALAKGINLVADALKTIAHFIGASDKAFLGLAGQAAGALFVLTKFRKTAIATSIAGIGTQAEGAATKMSKLASAAKLASGVGGLLLLMDASKRAGSSMGVLEDAAGGAMLGFSVAGAPGAVIGTVAGAFYGLTQEAKSLSDALEHAATISGDSSLKEIQTRIKELRAGLQDQATPDAIDFLPVVGPGIKKFRDMFAAGPISDAKNQLGHLRDLAGAARGKVTSLGAALAGPLTGGLTRSGGAAEYLTGKFEHLSHALDGSNSLVDYEEALDNMTAALKRNGGAWSASSTAGRDDIRTRNALISSAISRTQTLINKGRTADAQKFLTRAISDLRDFGADMPKNQRKIAILQALLKKLDGTDARAHADVDTKPGKKHLNDLGIDLGFFAHKRGTATGDVDNKPGKKSIADILNTLNIFAHKRGTATADVDKKPALTGLSLATGGLLNFGRKTGTATANVDISNGIARIGEIQFRLDHLRDKTVYVRVSEIRTGAGGQGGGATPVTAVGGIFTSPQTRLISEAGAEAVVPLNRPLSQVDPSVRWLSAIAQGLTGPAKGRTIDASGWTIVTPTEDPLAVATEALNLLAANAYG